MSDVSKLKNMLALGMLLGGPEAVKEMTAIMDGKERAESSKLFEDDPRWNGPRQIQPSECFISVGPGPSEDKFYPVLMAPKDSPLLKDLPHFELDEDSEYVTFAKLKAGFNKSREALLFAARMMKSVAIYDDIHDSFEWPYFNRFKAQAQLAAEERRARKRKKVEEAFAKRKVYKEGSKETYYDDSKTYYHSWRPKQK